MISIFILFSMIVTFPVHTGEVYTNWWQLVGYCGEGAWASRDLIRCVYIYIHRQMQRYIRRWNVVGDTGIITFCGLPSDFLLHCPQEFLRLILPGFWKVATLKKRSNIVYMARHSWKGFASFCTSIHELQFQHPNLEICFGNKDKYDLYFLLGICFIFVSPSVNCCFSIQT
jgi:hypothetical protein